VREQEPAVLVEAAGDLDGDVLAGLVELVELLHRGVDGREGGVDLRDDLGDGLVGGAEARGQLRGGGLRGDRAEAAVDREPQGDDALGGQVGPLLRVVDDRVEQFVHADEVGAAHVPVRLLSVDDERGEVDDHRAQELGDSGGDVRVGNTLACGDVRHCLASFLVPASTLLSPRNSATKLSLR